MPVDDTHILFYLCVSDIQDRPGNTPARHTAVTRQAEWAEGAGGSGWQGNFHGLLHTRRHCVRLTVENVLVRHLQS